MPITIWLLTRSEMKRNMGLLVRDQNPHFIFSRGLLNFGAKNFKSKNDPYLYSLISSSPNISFLYFVFFGSRHCLTLELKLKKVYPIIKMTTLKDFEAFLRVRDNMEGNDLTTEDLLKDFDDRIITITTSCDGVTKKFYLLASVANYMGVSLATVKYA